MASAIYRTGQVILNDWLRDLNISSGNMDALYAIMLHEGIGQTELGELLFVGKSAITKTIKILMDKGYVYRIVDPKDSRAYFLFLTNRGNDLVEQVKGTFQSFVALHNENLSKEEREQLAFLLKKVLDSLLQERERLDREN